VEVKAPRIHVDDSSGALVFYGLCYAYDNILSSLTRS